MQHRSACIFIQPASPVLYTSPTPPSASTHILGPEVSLFNARGGRLQQCTGSTRQGESELGSQRCLPWQNGGLPGCQENGCGLARLPVSTNTHSPALRPCRPAAPAVMWQAASTFQRKNPCSALSLAASAAPSAPTFTPCATSDAPCLAASAARPAACLAASALSRAASTVRLAAPLTAPLASSACDQRAGRGRRGKAAGSQEEKWECQPASQPAANCGGMRGCIRASRQLRLRRLAATACAWHTHLPGGGALGIVHVVAHSVCGVLGTVLQAGQGGRAGGRTKGQGR
jgi:hypothetical protein